MIGNKFFHNDLVYLVDDVNYDGKLLKKGQEFIVVKQELDVLECVIDGTDEVYKFTVEFVTDNPNSIVGSKEFIKTIISNTLIFISFIVVVIIFVNIVLRGS